MVLSPAVSVFRRSPVPTKDAPNSLMELGFVSVRLTPNFPKQVPSLTLLQEGGRTSVPGAAPASKRTKDKKAKVNKLIVIGRNVYDSCQFNGICLCKEIQKIIWIS